MQQIFAQTLNSYYKSSAGGSKIYSKSTSIFSISVSGVVNLSVIDVLSTIIDALIKASNNTMVS